MVRPYLASELRRVQSQEFDLAGVYVLTSHCNFKTCVNILHVNKTVTDLGGTDIPPPSLRHGCVADVDTRKRLRSSSTSALVTPSSCRTTIGTAGRRHLIMATPEQLSLLCRAHRWYMDATYWVVRKPFTQLFNIHCFLTNDGQ